MKIIKQFGETMKDGFNNMIIELKKKKAEKDKKKRFINIMTILEMKKVYTNYISIDLTKVVGLGGETTIEKLNREDLVNQIYKNVEVEQIVDLIPRLKGRVYSN